MTPMRLEHPRRSADEKTAVIVGAGFAGLNAAKRLANRPGIQVILIDRRNHHLFQPLLYQVATAGLNPSDIAVPIRAQFRRAANVDIHLGRIDGVDLEQQLVLGGGHELAYDYLILACGAHHSYFGHPEWEACAPGLKTIEQATEIRRRILMAFESAENELDAARREPWMTFVIVGAGPTGVELAGAIADISRTVLHRDFRHIDTTRARVVLVEAGPRVLSTFSESLSARAREDLIQLGVEVRTDAMVEAIDAAGVTIGGQRITSKTVFWAAGVQAVRLDLRPPPAADRAGRLKVTADLSLDGHPNVFVAGDMVSLEIGPGRLLPGVAPAAIQTGRHAAAMVLADLDGRPRRPFAYADKGQMATIGKNRAIAQTSRFALTGRIAWLAWLLVHVAYLIGFRNRLVVLTRWVWSYLFSRREARLITERDWTLRG